MTGIIALYIFMLAAFTGYEVISRVPVILHTPLMSGSNFVHGIVLVGAMVALGGAHTPLEKTIGVIGVLLAAGNAVGGYVVTERMLEMFKSSGARGKAAGRRGALMETDVLSRETLIQVSYLVTAALFILGLKRMSSPVTARSGILWAGSRHVGGDAGVIPVPGNDQLRADRSGHVCRRRSRVVERKARRHDRHAADDRALQRHGWRRGRGDRRSGAVPR